jgi:hypothetical protein
VWFGTEGSGLLAYTDNSWHQITTHDGIPHNSIRSLALDSKNNLWILTDNGIVMRKSSGIVHNQVQRDFLNTGHKHKITQRGNRFYVSSNNKPDKIQYTLFDLRGRTVLRQTIHGRRSFMLPKNCFGSGVRILSIMIEDSNKSQRNYFFNLRDSN